MLAVVVVAAVLAVVGLRIEVRSRLRKQGWHRLGYRWLAGHAWNGQPVDLAGWSWPGRWFWRMPRPKRAAVRCAATAAIVLTGVGWLTDPWLTSRFVIFVVLLLCIIAVSVLARVAIIWPHRRKWVGPLRQALAERHGLHHPPKVSRERDRVVQRLPREWAGDAKERAAIVDVIAAKTGIEGFEASWRLAGPAPQLVLAVSQPAPALVTLADVMPAIEAAKADELVWGLGKRGQPVKSSLSGDSPHIGISMGSGAGKSIAIRAILAQMLFHGAIALVIDYKQISQHWAVGLPNVSIVRKPHEIHAALCWLGGDSDPDRPVFGEINRRNAVALAGADLEGNVHAVVGPRLIIAAEELNATMKALRAYWRQMRDLNSKLPVRSPALDAFDMVNLMGRQTLMNALYVAQKLSAKAVGGDGDIRESIGVIALGRYRPSTWKQLAEDHPMPPSTRKPGRYQVVADDVTEVQGIKMTAIEARQLALAGVVSPLPAGMPGAVAAATHEALTGAEQGLSHGTTTLIAPPSGLVTLRQAVDEGIVRRKLPALRKASQRDPEFPRWADLEGTARLYRPIDLITWDES